MDPLSAYMRWTGTVLGSADGKDKTFQGGGERPWFNDGLDDKDVD